jgi:transposase
MESRANCKLASPGPLDGAPVRAPTLRGSPDLNPDEHVWSYVKGTFRSEPIAKGEDFDSRVEATMVGVASVPALVRSFFGHPAVAYVKKALNW